MHRSVSRDRVQFLFQFSMCDLPIREISDLMLRSTEIITLVE